MGNDTPAPQKEIQEILSQLPDSSKTTVDSFDIKGGEGYSESLIDAIEMIGEEKAAGLSGPSVSEITPGMRYLHCSRTIHQLVTDRNRAVGIYLAVASLLLTASGAIFNADPQGKLMIPFEEIQRWCLPITFATLTILAVFMAFLLIRTRVGLIYEVAKMNVLLGLPMGRVQHWNPLSIFFIMQTMISLGGGSSAAAFSIFMMRLENPEAVEVSVWVGVLIGIAVTGSLIALYLITVNHTTSDRRLQRLHK